MALLFVTPAILRDRRQVSNLPAGRQESFARFAIALARRGGFILRQLADQDAPEPHGVFKMEKCCKNLKRKTRFIRVFLFLPRQLFTY
jgi:hypothetical protein